MLANQINGDKLKSIDSNLWKEEPGCVEWLNSKEPNSIVYVNFGSITVIKPQQLIEFAWGLANSEKPFLWIIRLDLVVGGGGGGGGLMHSGWNSTLGKCMWWSANDLLALLCRVTNQL